VSLLDQVSDPRVQLIDDPLTVLWVSDSGAEHAWELSFTGGIGGRSILDGSVDLWFITTGGAFFQWLTDQGGGVPFVDGQFWVEDMLQDAR
jgi:hypothetical protein